MQKPAKSMIFKSLGYIEKFYCEVIVVYLNAG